MKWAKDIAQWQVGKTLYLSVVFSWDLPRAEAIARKHDGPVIVGGPAAMYATSLEWGAVQPSTPYDVLAMHNPMATFTTRGCPSRCPYCIVPHIEGEFRELTTWKPAPVVCDNNLLAASWSHLERVVDSLAQFGWADFNQGLDARRFTKEVAALLYRAGQVKLRFAFDCAQDESAVQYAIRIGRDAGHRSIGVYVLIGFRDTPNDAYRRLETVRSWGLRPNPMRYQPLNAEVKSGYVAPGWTDAELRRMTRYYSRLRWLEHIPYKDYRHVEADDAPLFASACRRRVAKGE